MIPLLQQLYNRAKDKYAKHQARLKKKIESRTFHEQNKRRQYQEVHTVKKLGLKLSRLQAIVAGGAVALVSAANTETIAQTFIEGLGPFTEITDRVQHPLRNRFRVKTTYDDYPSLVDLDGDGDLDLVMTLDTDLDYSYYLYPKQYYRFLDRVYIHENKSGVETPGGFQIHSETGLSLPGIDYSLYGGYPSTRHGVRFVDIDQDGDMDAFTPYGERYNDYSGYGIVTESGIAFFKNDGANNFTRYNYDANENPFNGITDQGPLSFVDIDNDGDLDAFIDKIFFRNTGNPVDPTDNQFTAEIGPFDGYTYNHIDWIDLDADGDQDAIVSDGGSIHFWRNDQVANEVTSFVQDDYNGAFDPIFNTNFANGITPIVADMDGDGDLDIIISDKYYVSYGCYGYDFRVFTFFENDGNVIPDTQIGKFTEQSGVNSPFGGVNVGFRSEPAWADIDGDNDLDLFVGSGNDGIYFYENMEEVYGQPLFLPRTGVNNPLDLVGPSYRTSPALVDLDQDGDLDAYVGSDNLLEYFYNLGSPASPANFQPADPANSLVVQSGLVGFSSFYHPTFEDIDADGDMDGLITMGGYSVGVDQFIFDNTGNPAPPSFAAGAQVYYDNRRDVELVDIDHDGDADMVVGTNYSGTMRFRINKGTYGFQGHYGALNPFDSNYGRDLTPSLADFDGDGDLDLLNGNDQGSLSIYENTNQPPDLSLNATPVNFTENSPAVLVDNAATILDPDVTPNRFVHDITVTIGNFQNGADVLSYTDHINITETWDPLTGTLILEDTATYTDYQTLLQSITFQNTSDNPIGATRNVSFDARDTDLTDAITVQRTINIIAVNDPPTLTSTAGTIATEDIIYNYTAAVTDLDDANDGVNLTWSLSGEPAGMTVSTTGVVSWTPLEGVLTSGAVTLTVQDGGENGALPSLEVFTLPVTPVNDAPTITSTAGTAADEGVLYTYTSVVDDPDDANDGTNLSWSLSSEPAGMTVDALGVVSWTPGIGVTTSGSVTLTVQDGGEDGALPFSEVFVIAVTVDTPPVVALTTSSFSYTENDGAQSIDPGISVTDDGTQLTGGLVTLTTNFTSGDDIIGFTNQSGITGTFDGVSGILTLTGTATIAQYETALGSLTFENTSDDPGAVTKTIEITLDDGANTSAVASLDVQITPVNDAPTISGSSGDLAYRSLTGSIVVDDQISLSDLDDTDLVGAIIGVASSYSAGEDILAFTDQNGITGSFNAVTGILTLSGTATVADYETALRSITYANTVPVPSAAGKPIEFQVSDASIISTAFSRTVVIASNQVIAGQIDEQADVGADLTIDVISSATFTLGDVITTTITSGPSFGTATVNPDGSILYTPSNDTANGEIDVITYELCNEYVSCGTNDINITISNTPPDVSIPLTEIEPGGVATVPLALGVSDQNGNFDPNSVIVAEQPFSGLPVTIDSDLNLIINYSGSGFQGADHIIIEVCDFSGACTQFDVVIAVGEVRKVLIYNGVTPNDDGINDVLRILDVEFFPENEMIVYNKLGRVVYNVQNYDNNSVVFSGIDNDNNKLEDGTYYYVIVLVDPDGKKLRQSGYIVLQR